ncbi:methyltransferase domain-containing protein [Limnoglobus roseus]|uniref:Methyltransferase type 11 domain-containing protein n=1 Tax=Limnoglobus roseus TaxID=2598579 RepID=A0A5C1AN81_9BACT|nr:methyltransferase domain-containing protein [Limnoglobus roseus]QEL19446.1 hypothetical protein PX52LOC_06518 [Limnoglobus roseus]
MKLEHFAAFRPLCPACRGSEASLGIDRVAKGDGHEIFEAMLACPNPACRAQYPVLDGIPVIVADARSVVAGSVLPLLARDDLSDLAEDVIAECGGPGSALDTYRQQLSSYAWDHYAEFDPAEPTGEPRPGAVARLLARGLALAGPTTGPALDLGCSVGRTTFELAAATSGLTLGIDLNLAKLRLAAAVLRTGRVRYPRRRVGSVYDRREFAVPLHRERVDFWACDVTALPLAGGLFGTVVSLNVLDSIAAPAAHLNAAATAMEPGGRLVLGCPYDWAPAATSAEVWLGGHSRRATHEGASEPAAVAALVAAGLTVEAEDPDVPWHVRMHDRATVTYRCHLMAASRTGFATSGRPDADSE